MLSQVRVQGLGCFDDDTYHIDFSSETLIAGSNNSGKSMFFSAINLLRFYYIYARLDWDTLYFRLHGFSNILNHNSSAKKISVVARFSETGNKDLALTIDQRNNVSLSFGSVRTHPGRDAKIHDLLGKIWFLAPNRSLVPFQSQVSGTSPGLQPLNPDGSNVINFLLERWTDQDENWNIAESWLRKIDPDMSKLKTPIRGSFVSLETAFNGESVNLSVQGSGFQSAAAIIAAVAFSPEGSTIIVEEPEAFLHPQSQEVIVDLLNDAVVNHGKQVIFSTHSYNMLRLLWKDVSFDAVRRGDPHITADPESFSMWTFEKESQKVSIQKYPLSEKTFMHLKEDFRYIWGDLSREREQEGGK